MAKKAVKKTAKKVAKTPTKTTAPSRVSATPTVAKQLQKKAKVAVKAVKEKVVEPVAKVMRSAVKGEQKPQKAKGKTRFELWSYDEYNQGSIIASGADYDVILKRAQQYITEINVDNALSAGEKNNAWEAYFPQIFKGKLPDPKTLYAGNKRDGKHYAYVEKDGEWSQVVLDKNTPVMFYLGQLQKGRERYPWYLTDHKGTSITNLNNQLLERKTVLFVKVV